MNKTENEVSGVSPSLGVLLVSFDEPKKAQQVKETLVKEIKQDGDLILDEMVMRVDEKRKVHVYEMGKAARGAAIVAVTWGLFGLLAGGLSGLVIWAVLGAICGGIYMYYVAHTLSDAELKNIARRMQPNTSVLLAFLKTSHAQQIIDIASRYTPTASTLVTVGEGMETRVISGTSEKAEKSSPTSTPVQGGADGDPLSILVFRYSGHQTARLIEAELKEEWKKAGNAIQSEMMIEVDEQRRVNLYDPSTGVRAQAISSMVSWGVLGLIVGVVACLISGSGGLLGDITSGLTLLITWGVFGIVAGTLAALVIYRAIPTSRLKKMSALFTQTQADTSVILALVEGSYTQKMTSDLSTHDAKGLIIRVKTPSSSKGGLELAVSNAV